MKKDVKVEENPVRAQKAHLHNTIYTSHAFQIRAKTRFLFKWYFFLSGTSKKKKIK